MPARDTATLHALTQQCSRAIAALFVRLSESGSHVADVAGRRLPWRKVQGDAFLLSGMCAAWDWRALCRSGSMRPIAVDRRRRGSNRRIPANEAMRREDPAERWMLPVLHLDPTITPAAAIGAFAMLGDQSSSPIRQLAGIDIAQLEVSQEDTVHAPVRRNKLRFPLFPGMFFGRS